MAKVIRGFESHPLRQLDSMQETKPIKTPPTGALDPVCGMTVDPARAAGRHEHAGVDYYFCCEGCRAKFAAAPEKYLAAGAKREVHAADVGGTGLLSIGGGSGASGADPGRASGGRSDAASGNRSEPLLTIGSGPSRAAMVRMPPPAPGRA